MPIPQTGKNPEKSVKISDLEMQSLVELRDTYNSFYRFALALGVNRASLIRIMQFGSGSEANIKIIRRKLSRITASSNS